MSPRLETVAGLPARAVALQSFAVLGAALAWFAHLNLMYLFVPVACRSELMVLFHLTTAALVGVAAASGVVALRLRRRQGEATRLMAGAGALLAPLFLLTIVLMWASTLVVDPCGP